MIDQSRTPAAFTNHPSPMVSDRYAFLPTTEVVKRLAYHGWFPVEVKQPRSKDNKYSKHIVVLESEDHGFNESRDGVRPNIIIKNSHNGTSCLDVSVGLFRLVCSNGLVVKDGYGEQFKIRHSNYTMENFDIMIEKVIAQFAKVYNQIEAFSKHIMTDQEKLDYALKACLLRHPESEEATRAGLSEVGDLDYAMLLKPKRNADQGDDLWHTFNVVQERLLKGDYAKVSLKKNNAVWTKNRNITAIDKNIKLNQDLWLLTEAFATPDLVLA